MSVEPELERSVLERKERDELQTIARALGAVPASRARKADLVDLILEQAGVPATEQSGATDRSGTTGATVAPTNGATDAARSNGADQSAPSDTAQVAVADAPVSTTDVPDTEPSVEADGPGAPGAGGPPAENARPTADRPEQAQGASRERDPNRRNGEREQSRDPRRPGDQRPDTDSDPGNRRRRRRGRDRDRDGRGEQRDRVDEQQQQQQQQPMGDPVDCAGLLDLRDEGYAFLRTGGFLPSKDDVYVSVKQVRQFGLRRGDHIKGGSRPANRNEKNPALLRIDEVNGRDPESARTRARFEDLTPLFPDEKLHLETEDPANMTARIVDLISPIGKGQRGLIVSPPKAGKTTVMKQIATSIETNHPEVHLMVLLVDERPEEVTDMRRTVKGAEVIASTFDRPSEEHTQVAELVIERAKRLVEYGDDVVIILDGITRLSRAYNLAAPASGRIMSGGVDSGALYPPKKFFGAARNIEEGGSLTILATALIETGSKMDEVIFEEFKGTGNMELRLDRKLAERRIYPALDVDASSTRHEELLFDRKQLQQVWRVRRALNALSSEAGSVGAALERLMDGMKTFKSNDEFLAEAAKTSGT